MTTNLAMGCPWHRGALEAGVSGGLIGGITGGLGYGIGRLAPLSKTTIYWPSKPHGTPGHWNAIKREVGQMVRSSEYSEIYVNKSLTAGTGGQIQSPIRPDILGRTMAGKYDVVEVVSPSQTYSQLQSKAQTIAQLLGGLFGRSKIILP